jgi:hypothetical protein
MQNFFFFFCFFASSLLFAETPICQPLALHGTTFKLTTNQPIFMIFHNTSMHNLFITPLSSSCGSSLIEPNKWSRLAVIQKDFSFTCIESTPGHEQSIPCENALTVCQLPIDTKSIAQSQWIGENTNESYV